MLQVSRWEPSFWISLNKWLNTGRCAMTWWHPIRSLAKSRILSVSFLLSFLYPYHGFLLLPLLPRFAKAQQPDSQYWLQHPFNPADTVSCLIVATCWTEVGWLLLWMWRCQDDFHYYQDEDNFWSMTVQVDSSDNNDSASSQDISRSSKWKKSSNSCLP